MSNILGQDCKLYYGAGLISGSGPGVVSWTEITNVRDLTLNVETGEADVTTRGSGGWVNVLAALKDGSLEFEMVWNTTDAAFAAIETAWEGNDEISLMALDGDKDVAGSEGLASNFIIKNFRRSEPLTDAVKVSITARPSSYTDWYTVVGS